MGNWRKVEDIVDLPVGPGCYALIEANGSALYIGQTNNLSSRLGSGHGWRISGDTVHTAWGPFRAAVKIRVGMRFGEWLMLEARLIRKLRPSLNKKLLGVPPNRRRSLPQMDFTTKPLPERDPSANVAIFKQPLYSLRELSHLWQIEESTLKLSLGRLVVDAVSRDALLSLSAEISENGPDKARLGDRRNFVYRSIPEA